MNIRNSVYESPVFFCKSGRSPDKSATAVPVWKALKKADEVDVRFKGSSKEVLRERFVYVPIITADGRVVLEIVDAEEEARAAQDPPPPKRPDPVRHDRPHPSDEPDTRPRPVPHTEPEPPRRPAY
jgi:hypothetical protein